MNWQWSRFEDLNIHELYQIMVLRQEVFVVEQNCPFLDADGQDQKALHLLGRQDDNNHLAVYLRILIPDNKNDRVSIGRVVTSPACRGEGLGKLLVAEAVGFCRSNFPDQTLWLGAQAHLELFYKEFGFQPEGDPYEEDGIPHIGMINTK